MKKSRQELLAQRARRMPGPPWTVTADWNTGHATSGEDGADLFTYGAPNQWWRLADCYLRLFPGVWNLAAHITIRAYMNIMGGETKIMDEEWDADGTDGDVAFIIWFWDVPIFGPLRIEVHSDAFGDDGVAVPFEYRVKDW